MTNSASSALASGAVRDTVATLGLALVRGDFAPESVLPKEEQLAERFAVGRSTLREAVKVLSGKGLVRTARRYGSRVCPRTEWNMLDPEVLAWHLTDPAYVLAFIGEITEVRAIIEPGAAALAAKRATAAQAARLLATAEMLEAADARGALDTAIDLDVTFHLALLEASHNRLLGSFGRSLSVALRAQFELSRDYFPSGPARYHADDKHVRLAKAIGARDANAASEISASMFRMIQKWVRSALRQGSVSESLKPHLSTSRRPRR